MRAKMDSDAVAQTVAFIVASAFFLGIFGTLVLATGDTPASDGREIQDAANRVDAERLADVLVASPGTGWESGPDGVTRLGFQHDDGTRLDDTRLDALRGAAYDADPTNGKIDYEEALEGLGLPTDGSLGFHVRMAPVGLQKTLQEVDLSHIHTCYVGDWPNLDLDITVAYDDNENVMLADARAQIDAQIEFLTAQERQVIDSIGLGYDDLVDLNGFNIEVDLGGGLTVPIEAALSDIDLLDGDVYVDQKQYLDATLATDLGDCEILIVGSTVDHESLTSNAVKDPISDWVLDGGTLMVMGSETQNFQWLQPLFEVGTTTVNAAPAAPDVSHPLLNEPWELDWTSYDNFGLGWNLKEEGAKASFDKFQHIITSEEEDILAVSNEGAFGEGRIFLTTFRPEDIAQSFGSGGLTEATHLVSNLVLYSDRADLYLDYGPTPPDTSAISAAVRTTQIWDEDLGMVNIRITVLYWGI